LLIARYVLAPKEEEKEKSISTEEIEDSKSAAGEESKSKDDSTNKKNAVEEKILVPPVEVVEITFDDNLKERRGKLVEQIWTGVQCASCGLRFAADQTLR